LAYQCDRPKKAYLIPAEQRKRKRPLGGSRDYEGEEPYLKVISNPDKK
jgi:hypothetical protein